MKKLYKKACYTQLDIKAPSQLPEDEKRIKDHINVFVAMTQEIIVISIPDIAITSAILIC